ncbi:MAG: dihydropteroate synthase [Phycisphaeraceae bacterium]
MGILNLTPDSFSDGGRFTDPHVAVSHALTMVEQGADIIDVGGESTRPGACRVDPDTQIRRVEPVIRALREKLDEQFPHIPISIDTTLSEVASAAVRAGATILNDVSAGREDLRMLKLAADMSLPIILMHMQGEPGTMQDAPTYGDVVEEIRQFLLERAEAAVRAGIDRRRIVIDPGIGFGKTLEHNLALLRAVGRFVDTGYPLLIGASRKRFISAFGRGRGPDDRSEPDVHDRLGGTCAVTTHCVQQGVQLLRVHDVAPNRQAADLAWALAKAEKSG